MRSRKRRVILPAVFLALAMCAAIAFSGCGGGGGGGNNGLSAGGVTPPPPGGGGGSTSASALSGQLSPQGSGQAGSFVAGGVDTGGGVARAAAAPVVPAGKTVHLAIITSQGTYTQTGLTGVADVVTDANGKFTFPSIPAGVKNLVVQCVDCTQPLSEFVPVLAGAKNDIGAVTEENDAQQKVVAQLLTQWAAAPPPGTTQPVAPENIDFNQVKAMVSLNDAKNLLDYSHPTVTPPALVTIAQSIKAQQDVEDSTLSSLGGSSAGISAVIGPELSKLYGELKAGTLANLDALEKQLATDLQADEAAGTLPQGFTRMFLEARSKGYEILKTNIQTMTTPPAVATQIDGAQKDVESDKFIKRAQEEVVRLKAVIDRLTALACPSNAAATVACLSNTGTISESDIMTAVQAAEKSFETAAAAATTTDAVSAAFDVFQNQLVNAYNNILQYEGISPQTFNAILDDLKSEEAAFQAAVAAAASAQAYQAAVDKFNSQSDSTLNSVKYLLTQAFPTLATNHPDVIGQLTLINGELIQLIAFKDIPLPPPVIGPPPGGQPGPAITAIAIVPTTASVQVKGQQQFKAVGTTATGTVDVKVVWYVDSGQNTICGTNATSSNGDPALCANNIGYIDANGLFTGVAPGTGKIVATLELYPNSGAAPNSTAASTAPSKVLTATAQITVTDINPPPAGGIVSIKISPATVAPLNIGQTQQFTATGVTSDGKEVPVTAEWAVDSDTPKMNPADASPTCGGYVDPTTNAPVLGNPACLPPGGLDAPPIGHIDPSGLFTAEAPGTGKIVAILEQSGDKAPLIASVPVTVNPADKIAIAPHDPQTLKIGDTLLFKAYSITANSTNPVALNNVEWHTLPLVNGKPVTCDYNPASANPTSPNCVPAGGISADGLFTAYNPGQVLVVATLPAPNTMAMVIQDSVVVTVAGGTPPASGADIAVLPDSIVFDPQSPEEGQTATIYAAVSNAGPNTATNIVVAFSNTSNGVTDVLTLIGKATIATLAPGAVAKVSVTWNTSGQLGPNKIMVEAQEAGDPNPDNNTAWASAVIVCPAGKYMNPTGTCTTDLSGVFINIETTQVVAGGQAQILKILSDGKTIYQPGTAQPMCGNVGRAAVESIATDLVTAGFFDMMNPPNSPPTAPSNSIYLVLGERSNWIAFTGDPPTALATVWKKLTSLGYFASGALTTAACNTGTPVPPDAQQCPPPSSSAAAPAPQVCPMIYAPVCGSDGITYGNGCYACGNTSVTWWKGGACGEPNAVAGLRKEAVKKQAN